MSLKIIGAGFGRTGTKSTYTALNELGYRCYHMAEVLDNKENKSHVDFWNRVANAPAGRQHDWSEVFEHYTATMDNPGSCVWRELIEAYPEAKVLLTLHPRGAEAWYESALDTIFFTQTVWQFKFLKLVTPFARKMGNMTSKLIWQRTLHGTMTDKAAAVARYHEHVEEVKAAVPPEKLLVYSVDQGWEPLCEFLGVEVPKGPFPNVNDRAEFRRNIAGIKKGAYALMAAGGLALVGLTYAAVKWSK